jgi:hypothetical protein
MYIQNVLQFVKFVLLRYTDFGFFSFPFKLSELGITSINYIFNISFILIFFQFFFLVSLFLYDFSSKFGYCSFQKFYQTSHCSYLDLIFFIIVLFFTVDLYKNVFSVYELFVYQGREIIL